MRETRGIGSKKCFCLTYYVCRILEINGENGDEADKEIDDADI